MTRAERAILKHVRQIRLELQDNLTPRRTFDALRLRILKRLDKIEDLLELEPTDADRAFLARARAAYLAGIAAGTRDLQAEREPSPEDEERILAWAERIADEAEHSAALDVPAPGEEGAHTVSRSVPP